MEQAKRALVGRWLDPSGGMGLKSEIMLTLQHKKKREFAEGQNSAMVVLSLPVGSYVGAITATV